MTQTRVKYIKNIVQKNVGQLGQLFIMSVNIVEKKLKLPRVLTNNIVVKSVEIRDMLVKNILKNIVGKLVKLLKVKFQRMLGSLENYIRCGIQIGQTKERGLLINIKNGGMLLLKEIGGFVRYVEISVQAVRSSVLTTLNHSLCILSCDMRLAMGESYVTSAIGKHQLIVGRNRSQVL